MRILVSQINPIIGDLTQNTERILHAIENGRQQKADLVVFPELALTGYPPEDFLLLPHFMEAVANHLSKIIEATSNIAILVGLPRYNPHKREKHLYNSAAFISNRVLIDYADKILLPTYDVFDERRYFEPGEEVKVWSLKDGKKFGVIICEDLWQHSGTLQGSSHASLYRRDPILELQNEKLECVINLSASPYSTNKMHTRLNACLKASKTLNCPLILCNQVGGNDSLIFDGTSLYVSPSGLLQCAKSFVEDDMLVDLSEKRSLFKMEQHGSQNLFDALVLGLKDYVKKSHFQTACLGLSGGIDSAIVACLATHALGPQNVFAYYMPSRYSSFESGRDAKRLAENLAIHYDEISIEDPFESYLTTLSPFFEQKAPDITEENLQSRIRGMFLMAFSNKFGHLVLSTGNKSELALGYSTLYGDMCGGLSVIGDLTKQQVYELGKWINRHQEIIPSHILTREPSAELRPNQRDRDTLPDYAIIDQVVTSYIEDHHSPDWISKHFNFPLKIVQDLIKRIHQNEYKRRQAPPSLRVSEKSFSIGRRFPITQKWV